MVAHLALAAALLACGVVVAVPASAQEVLVSNTEQPSGGSELYRHLVMGFRTGPNGGRLDRIDVRFASIGANFEIDEVDAWLRHTDGRWSANTIATLVNPKTVSPGSNRTLTFTVPSGAILDGNRNYYFTMRYANNRGTDAGAPPVFLDTD